MFLLFLITVLMSLNCSTAESKSQAEDRKNLLLLEQNVESTDRFFNEGKSALLKKEYGNALEYFSKSEYSQALFFKGLTLVEIGKKEEATEIFQKCIDKNILISESYYNLSMIAYDSGEIENAKDMVLKAVSYDPENTGALFFAGNLFFVENDMVKSLDFYKKAVATAPDSTDLWDAVLSVYIQTGEYQKGWELRDKVDRKSGEIVLALLKLAELTGNFAEGASLPDKQLLADPLINQQVRILLTRAGKLNNAFQMAQEAAKNTEKPYIMIDRVISDETSYVLAYKNGKIFLVCSKDNEKFIPVEIIEEGIKVEGTDTISFADMPSLLLKYCGM